MILTPGRIQNVAEDMESIQEYGFDPLYYPFEFPPPENYSDKIVCVTTASANRPLPVPAEIHIQESIRVNTQLQTPSLSPDRTPNVSPNQTPNRSPTSDEAPPTMRAASTPCIATPNDQMSLLDSYEVEAAVKATEAQERRDRGKMPKIKKRKASSALCCVVM